jgi:hypothetical protein
MNTVSVLAALVRDETDARFDSLDPGAALLSELSSMELLDRRAGMIRSGLVSP